MGNCCAQPGSQKQNNQQIDNVVEGSRPRLKQDEAQALKRSASSLFCQVDEVVLDEGHLNNVYRFVAAEGHRTSSGSSSITNNSPPKALPEKDTPTMDQLRVPPPRTVFPLTGSKSSLKSTVSGSPEPPDGGEAEGPEADRATGAAAADGHLTAADVAALVATLPSFLRPTTSSKFSGGYLLPPQDASNQFKLVVVMGLDRTLTRRTANDSADRLDLCVRPHVQALLSLVGKHCEAVVWTRGNRPQAKAAIAAIDPSHAIQHCIYADSSWESCGRAASQGWWDTATDEEGWNPVPKALNRLGRNLHRVLAIEAGPATAIDYPRNTIVLPQFRAGEEGEAAPLERAHCIPALVSVIVDLLQSGMTVPQFLSSQLQKRDDPMLGEADTPPAAVPAAVAGTSRPTVVLDFDLCISQIHVWHRLRGGRDTSSLSKEEVFGCAQRQASLVAFFSGLTQKGATIFVVTNNHASVVEACMALGGMGEWVKKVIGREEPGNKGEIIARLRGHDLKRRWVFADDDPDNIRDCETYAPGVRTLRIDGTCGMQEHHFSWITALALPGRHIVLNPPGVKAALTKDGVDALMRPPPLPITLSTVWSEQKKREQQTEERLRKEMTTGLRAYNMRTPKEETVVNPFTSALLSDMSDRKFPSDHCGYLGAAAMHLPHHVDTSTHAADGGLAAVEEANSESLGSENGTPCIELDTDFPSKIPG